MVQRLALVLVIGLATHIGQPAWGQYVQRGGPSVDLRRHGLESMWQARVELNPARDRLAHVRLHASRTRVRTITEIRYNNRREVLTEDMIDRFGDRLGREGMQEQADRRVAELAEEGIEAEIETRHIPDIVLIAVTDEGVVHALDGETGETRWITRVGKPNERMMPPAISERYVAIVKGVRLYLLDLLSGQLRWERLTRHIPGGAPELSRDHVFVTATNGALEAYDLEGDVWPRWIYRARGRGLVDPVYTGRHVVWATDIGDLYVADASELTIRYRLEARSAIVSPATFLEGRLFVTAADGFAYCIREASGDLLWRFATGEPIHQSPIPIGNQLFVIPTVIGMFSLSIDDGTEQWWAPDVARFLAASDTRVYCQDNSGRILILSRDGGVTMGELATYEEDIVLENRDTDRLVIGNSNGLLRCFRESHLHWPFLHFDEPVPEEPDPAAEEPPEPPEPPQPVAPDPVDDPFAPPTVDDPFAPMTDDPFQDFEDPFGDPFGID